MRFAFDADQLALRDAVRDLLAKECPPEVVRAAWPDGTDALGARKGEGARADAARLDRVWIALAEMGVLGVATSEAHGGLGMTPLDWVLVAEETGYAAVPQPFVETALVVAPLAAAADDPHGVVADLVAGNRLASALPLGTSHVPWGDRVTYLVRLDHRPGPAGAAPARGGSADTALGSAGDGSAGAGPDASSAGTAAVVGRAGVGSAGVGSVGAGSVGAGPDVGSAGLGGTWVASRVDAGVTIGPEGRRDLADVLDPGRHVVTLGAWRSADQLGGPGDAAAAFDRGALAVAAQLVGLGRRMLDLTVGYVVERRQFGVPIGSFQAVKHHLADAALRLEFAAPAVYGAAWSLACGQPSAARDVSVAKALASDAARLTGRIALQGHGAIGYTTECDLHLYLKRAEALSRAWGDAAWHRREVADALGI